MDYRITNGLVWRSTPESIAAGAVSAFALLEVIGSVIGLWMLWAWVGTLLPLYVSMVAAPFLLLRSAASVEWAVARWNAWFKVDEAEDVPLWSVRGVATIGVSALVTFVSIRFLAQHWLPGHEGWALFWRAALLGIAAMNIALALALAVAGAEAGALAGAAAGALAGAAAGALALAVAVALALAVAVAVAFVFLGPGIAGGFWSASLMIRLGSIALNLRPGLDALPGNWRRLMISEDAFHAPELIPGGGNRLSGKLTVADLLHDLRNGPGWDERLIALITLPILYLPALLWRYSLKATAPVYLPLVYVVSPGKLTDLRDREVWLDTRLEFGAWLLHFVALGSLGFIAYSAVSPERIRDLAATVGGHVAPVPPVIWVAGLDPAKLWEVPWHASSGGGAFFSIVLFWMAWARRNPRLTLKEKIPTSAIR